MYLSGIEIELTPICVKEMSSSKLYLSGIEILIDEFAKEGAIHSKLYLSGIEIARGDSVCIKQRTLNCTLVELKLTLLPLACAKKLL